MKKFLLPLALTLATIPFATAADINLKDGRLLQDASVVRHDAATVTFRHSGGFAQVEKAKLPESLLAQYPLDTELAAAEAQRHAQAALARQAEAKRLQEERLQLAAETATQEEPPNYDQQPPAPKSETVYTPIMPGTDDRWYFERSSNRRRQHWNRPHTKPTPPAPAPDLTIRMTPDVHMTADVRMTADLHAPATAQTRSVSSADQDEEIDHQYCPRESRRTERRDF